MPTILRAVFIAVCSAFLCAGAHATVYEVSPTGNDANDGSAALPWKTLQKAADTVKAGDKVWVNNGTYAGFRMRTSGTAAARITFQAKTKWGAKVNAPGPKADVDLISVGSASYVTIDGFETTGAPRAGIGVRSWFLDDGSDTRNDIVQNCYSHDNGLPSGGAHDGIFTGFALNFTAQDNVCDHNGEHGIYISNSADNPIVRRNVCSNNRACGIQLNADLNTGNGDQDGLISNWLVERNIIFGNGTSGGAAINLDGDINGKCLNNLIYNNLASGITLYAIDGARPSSNNLVANNTIYNPNSTRAALYLDDGANNNVAFNNILLSGKGMDVGTVSGFTHDYNVVSSYAGTSKAAHETVVALAKANTLFINISGADFHLSPTSPALNSGVATYGGKNAPVNDLENKPRPSGAALDRGCYETQAVGGPPANVSVSPNNASNAPGTQRVLTSNYSDPDGADDLSRVYLRANFSSAPGINVQYNATKNLLYMRNDDDTAYIGGFAPGSANVITTKWGQLNCAQTVVTQNGVTLTVNWAVTPSIDLAGQQLDLSLLCYDLGNLKDDWEKFGTWKITS
jgi:parallel beta-helix repeat protein